MQPLAMNGDAHSCTGRSEPSQPDLGVCRVCPERAALGWAVPSGAGSSERIQLRCWELAARQLLHGKRTEQTRLGHGAPEATVPCRAVPCRTHPRPGPAVPGDGTNAPRLRGHPPTGTWAAMKAEG